MKRKTTALISGLIVSGATAGYMYISKKLFLGAMTRSHSLKLKDTTDYSLLDEKNKEAIENWLPTTRHEHVYIHSNDHLRLHAYQFRNEGSNKWIIAIHGYKTTSHSLMDATREFYQAGYNILLVDNRTHGKSEGTYIGMGWLDRIDILQWIEYLNAKEENINIALYGVSMGGSTVMMSVGEELPDNVTCAIADCGYTSANDILLERAKVMYPGPIEFLFKGFDIYCKSKAKYSTYDADSTKQLRKAKIPMLFIHGDADTFVPIEMAFSNYESCASEKELFIARKKGHALSCLDPKYYEAVLKFIQTHL